jgi:hypothetical protein
MRGDREHERPALGGKAGREPAPVLISPISGGRQPSSDASAGLVVCWRPLLEVGVVAAHRISLEQIDRVLMGVPLHLVVILAEVIPVQGLQLVQLGLMAAVHRGRQISTHLPTLHQ